MAILRLRRLQPTSANRPHAPWLLVFGCTGTASLSRSLGAMSARSPSRPRVAPRQAGGQQVDDDVIDLREHGGPPRRRRSGVDARDWHAVARPNVRRPRRGDPSRVAKGQGQLRDAKFFGSPGFRRLWLSQVFSSLGDWIGLVAITAIAASISSGDSGGAVALVLAVRLIPGLIASPFVGVVLDRWNRKPVMVATDIGRGMVLCLLPFVHNLPMLILASLFLEIMTLMWSSAKEATVPTLVKDDFLPTANSLSLIASYGTVVPAAAVVALLAKVPDWLGQTEHFASLHLTKESLALYFDAITYVLSALIVATLAISRPQRAVRDSNASRAVEGWNEFVDGLRFIVGHPRVRTVMVGMATGLLGGGVVVPLGPDFVKQVLGAGSSGFGLLMTALGIGVGIGVGIVWLLQKRLPTDRTFVAAIFGAGIALALTSVTDSLGVAMAGVALLGIFTGAIYVLSMTILQLSADVEVRGRVFTSFYAVTRVCIVCALILAPWFSSLFGNLSDRWLNGSVEVFNSTFVLPGVRFTLWGGSLVILLAGWLAFNSLRRSRSLEADASPPVSKDVL